MVCNIVFVNSCMLCHSEQREESRKVPWQNPNAGSFTAFRMTEIYFCVVWSIFTVCPFLQRMVAMPCSSTLTFTFLPSIVTLASVMAVAPRVQRTRSGFFKLLCHFIFMTKCLYHLFIAYHFINKCCLFTSCF